MSYIKYKRIEEICETLYDIQKIFDMLITDGFEIIQYQEKKESHNGKDFFYTVLIIAGKLRNNKINL
jgi:hypothetical protein